MELQDRVDDKMWLVKHLERTRQRVLDDLIVVKVCTFISYIDEKCTPFNNGNSLYIAVSFFLTFLESLSRLFSSKL